MNRSNRTVNSGRRWLRRLAALGGGLTAAWLLALTANTLEATWYAADRSPNHAAGGQLGVGSGADHASAPGRPAWGSEVLAAAREQAFDLVPFSVANACGIGASSCFKCHNGTRAAAPKADKTASPWHPDHKTVNDSCVGCHAGNARLIKKEIAHAQLISDPRGAPERCAGCHKSGDSAALLKTYQAIAAGGKKS